MSKRIIDTAKLDISVNKHFAKFLRQMIDQIEDYYETKEEIVENLKDMVDRFEADIAVEEVKHILK